MKTAHNIFISFLYLVFTSGASVFGQGGPNADEYMRIAEDYKGNQKPDSALIFYQKASTAFEASGNFEKAVHAHNQIGVILTRQDKYEEAQLHLDKALALGMSSLDTNSLLVATTYISLGVNYAAKEDYTQSLFYHYKALNIRLLKLGEFSADVATSYGNIGNVYLRSKDYSESIEAHQKAMVIREKIFGETGVEVIQSYTNLGTAYKEQGDYLTSLLFYNKALHNKILQTGEGHRDLGKFYKNISDVHYLAGNAVEGDFYKAKSEEVSAK